MCCRRGTALLTKLGCAVARLIGGICQSHAPRNRPGGQIARSPAVENIGLSLKRMAT
jgi:hypothetical protein